MMQGLLLTGNVALPEFEDKVDILMLDGFQNYFMYEIPHRDSLMLREYCENGRTFCYLRLLPF